MTNPRRVPLVALVLLLACAAAAEGQTVRGLVVDPDQNPLAGAELLFGGRSVVTGDRGAFRVDGVPVGEYELHIESRAGFQFAQTMAKPNHSCLSGQLAEGEYTYWFETASGAKSPTSKLTIEFDNAAATASIRSVTEAPDGSLHVEGSVLQGWKIIAGGKASATDASGRFSVDLRPEAPGAAVPIVLEHPERKTHVYVVRAPKK
jgi:hypothetical protein